MVDDGVIANVVKWLSDTEVLAFTATCKALAWFRGVLLPRVLPLREVLEVNWAWLWARRYNIGPPPEPVRWVVTLYRCPQVESTRVKCVSACRLWMNATASVEHMEAFRVIGCTHTKECYAQGYVSNLKEYIQKLEAKRKADTMCESMKAAHAAEKRMCKMSYILKGHQE